MRTVKLTPPNSPSRRRPLTHFQQTFCEIFALCGNATSSYVCAYPRAAKWKRRSAGRKAVDLLKDERIIRRIQDLTRRHTAARNKHFDAYVDEELRREASRLVNAV